MFNLSNLRTYALTVGILLFLFGLFGFAFKSAFDIANGYLIAGLILGFWGIVVGSMKE